MAQKGNSRFNVRLTTGPGVQKAPHFLEQPIAVVNYRPIAAPLGLQSSVKTHSTICVFGGNQFSYIRFSTAADAELQAKITKSQP